MPTSQGTSGSAHPHARTFNLSVVALGEVCAKQPHGVVPSAPTVVAVVEETKSMLVAEVLKEAA